MARTREQLNAAQQRWRSKNPGRAAAIARASRARNIGKRRANCRKWHLKVNYGLTPEQYAAMLLEQNGVCAVCRQPETGIRRGELKSLDVDHDHKTGAVRKLLCSGCNSALGILREDPLRIRALADYIERY